MAAKQTEPPGIASNLLTELAELAKIELPSEEIIPEMQKLIPELIPCKSQLFFWATKDGDAENFFSLNWKFNHLAKLYYQEFYNRDEKKSGIPGFTQFVVSGDSIYNTIWNEERYQKSSLVREVLWKDGSEQMLFGILRGPGGRQNGMLILVRSLESPAFSKRDEQMMNTILGVVEGVLNGRRRIMESSSTPIAIGNVTFGRDGRITGVTPDGDSLLRLIIAPDLNPSQPMNWLDLHIDQLRGTGRSGPEASWQTFHGNKWGQFKVRCEPMLPVAFRSVPAMGPESYFVTLQRYGSLGMQLYTRIKELGIAPRGRRVIWLLSQGLTAKEIAQTMGVSVNTVQTHINRIYQKLNISSQKDLLTLLQQG